MKDPVGRTARKASQILKVDLVMDHVCSKTIEKHSALLSNFLFIGAGQEV